VPAKLVVVGAGAIGAWELGYGVGAAGVGGDGRSNCWRANRAGLRRGRGAPGRSGLLQKQGIKFELGAKVTGLSSEQGQHLLTAQREGQALFPSRADKILVGGGPPALYGGTRRRRKPACSSTRRAHHPWTKRGSHEFAGRLCHWGCDRRADCWHHKPKRKAWRAPTRGPGRPGTSTTRRIPNIIYTGAGK